MTLKSDLMFPFGNPVKDRVTEPQTLTALNNVLKLAKDKIRISNGEMEEILLMGGGGSSDDYTATQSIDHIQQLIEYLHAQE